MLRKTTTKKKNKCNKPFASLTNLYLAVLPSAFHVLTLPLVEHCQPVTFDSSLLAHSVNKQNERNLVLKMWTETLGTFTGIANPDLTTRVHRNFGLSRYLYIYLSTFLSIMPIFGN